MERAKILNMAMCLGVGLALGVGCTTLYYIASGAENSIDTSCLSQYPLTNHNIDCNELEQNSQTLQDVDHSLDAAVAQYIQEGRATDVSVWVRELNTSQWASTNENDLYSPASLLKVPLMIAYYKIAELEPTILTSQLVYTNTGAQNDSIQDYAPAQTLTVGKSYTVETLIEDMIENSDNNATSVLLKHVDQNIFTQTLLDLGIEIQGKTSTHDFVNAKSYAGIFRQLYNSTYLNRTYSQQALSILSKTTFPGIRASIASSTVVADKFGEREVDNPDGSVQTRELHDCGVVYKTDDPYVICIMTSGSDFAQLQQIIQDLSQITYSNM